MQVETVPVSALAQDARNARLHPDENLAAIKASLSEFGQVEPLVVQLSSGRVIGGNGRLRAMLDLGWSEARVVRLDLDDARATALGLALNRTAELATWDTSTLTALVEELSAAGAPVAAYCFGEAALAEILAGAAPPVPPAATQDEVPELPKVAVTKPGDVWQLGRHRVVCGDAGALPFEDESIATCVTSPPYWGLRDYGVEEQLGLEAAPEQYIEKLVEIFQGCRRVLRGDGTLWLNLGDSYASGEVGRHDGGGAGRSLAKAQKPRTERRTGQRSGLKPKDLVGIPWRAAFALQADGWWLRSDVIWHKPNPMPESVTDRPTKAHEYIFLLAKAESYRFDAAAVQETASDPGREAQPGYSRSKPEDPYSGHNDGAWGEAGVRNIRSVWTITPRPYSGAHFAVSPPPCRSDASRRARARETSCSIRSSVQARR